MRLYTNLNLNNLVNAAKFRQNWLAVEICLFFYLVLWLRPMKQVKVTARPVTKLNVCSKLPDDNQQHVMVAIYIPSNTNSLHSGESKICQECLCRILSSKRT